jgi:uncharacterized damage-inducible protein DinB
MEIKKLLQEQFAVTNSQKNWFATLMSAIDGLTEEQSRWKPQNADHSIYQLVAHLYFWNNRFLNRMKNIPNEKMPDDNDSTFESEESWSSLIEKLKTMMNDFENEIGKLDEAKLVLPVSAENKSPWYSVISNTNLHNAYHTGQIVLLRKMQEMWYPKKNGVN